MAARIWSSAISGLVWKRISAGTPALARRSRSSALAAVLTRHADRMTSLLGETRIIDDPGPDGAVPLNLRQNLGAHHGQQRLIGPVRLGDKGVKGWVSGLHAARLHARGDRLDALALTGQEQTRAGGLQRCRSIRVTEHARQLLHISCKARFPRFCAIPVIHPSRRHEIPPRDRITNPTPTQNF